MIRILTESLKFDFVISDVNLMQQKGEKKYNIHTYFLVYITKYSVGSSTSSWII